ncbi:HET-domain-containing protein [Thozetella sp. PMI_491]|nr:HET-domain-containing protein [Thozetella sp. PMI_491]
MSNSDRSRIYQSLDPDRLEIRILSILPGDHDSPIACSLRTASLLDDPPFEALSYVWGTPSDSSWITLEGIPWNTTANLLAALKRLRQVDQSRAVWIDALCINQDDIAERSEQVTYMRKIYSQANSVTAWLGEDEGPTDKIVLALKIFEEIFTLDQGHWGQRMAWMRVETPHVYTHLLGKGSSFHQAPKVYTERGPLFKELFPDMPERPPSPPTPPTHNLGPLTEDDINTAFMAFSAHEYWQRIWTLQEIVVAREAVLVRGTCQISAGVPLYIAGEMSRHVDECCIDFARSHSIHAAYKGLARLAHYWGLHTMIAKNGQPEARYLPDMELGQMQRFFGSRRATDPRDHVFGLLPLVYDERRHGIKPDYSQPIAEVFADATAALVNSTESLEILEQVACYQTRMPGLPSWAMDWAVGEREIANIPITPKIKEFDMFDASKGRPGSLIVGQGGKATVEGIKLDQVSKLVFPDFDTAEHNRAEILRRRAAVAGCEGSLSRIATYNTFNDASTEQSGDRYDAQLDRFHVFALTLLRGVEIVLLDSYIRAKADTAVGQVQNWLYETKKRAGLRQAADGRMSQELSDMSTNIKTQSFFATASGYMGSGPAGAAEGDWVAVLYGLDSPCLLREVSHGADGSCYRFIGTAYIHGLMDGEAVNLVTAGTARDEKLTLI